MERKRTVAEGRTVAIIKGGCVGATLHCNQCGLTYGSQVQRRRSTYLMATNVTSLPNDHERDQRHDWQQIQSQKLEAVGELAAGIAHEINTPTQFVSDNLHFLKEAFAEWLPTLQLLLQSSGLRSSSPPEEFRNTLPADGDFLLAEIPVAIEQSLEGIDRIVRIVHSMRQFCHPGTQCLTSVQVSELIQNCLTVSHGKYKHVADVVTCFDESGDELDCYASELNQVILNLIINASQAIADQVALTGERGLITLTTKAENSWLEIQVADTGPGIPTELQDKIFDPFFTTKAVGQGTGQGLALARQVVAQQHRGTIEVTSTEGEGATFVIRLPRDLSVTEHGEA